MQPACSTRLHKKSCLDSVPEIEFHWLLWCIVATDLLRMQVNAASGITATAKVGFVRLADLHANRSESPVSAPCADTNLDEFCFSHLQRKLANLFAGNIEHLFDHQGMD